MKRIAVLLAVAASLVAVSSASAITKSTAQASARGWQHWACGDETGRHCVNWKLVSPTCTGPTRGQIQWVCQGFTLESDANNSWWCTAESAWNPYNFLMHTYYKCNIGLQNLRW